jgi:hypothetical protein
MVEQTIFVERRPRRVQIGPDRERSAASVEFAFRRPGKHPIFEAIDGDRWFGIIGDHE